MELSKVQQVARRCCLAFAVILLTSCDKVTSGGPLDREAALQRSQLNLRLPPSAYDVYYLYVDRGSQDQDLFVRFSGEPKDIGEFVTAEFENNKAFARKLGRPVSEPVIGTDKAAMTKKPWGKNRKLPDWWNPETIKKGRYFGSKPEPLPGEHFWIDETEGRAFFFNNGS